MTAVASSPASDPAAEAAVRLPVSVLTGFLGSGKTTLLAELLRHPEMSRVACIINEFGEISLDHLLVTKSTEDMVVLGNGCLCCTVRGDLIDTLCDLFMRRVRGECPEFDRVVIETTGLADPVPVLHALMSNPLVAARYRLDGVVTTVDAVHGVGQLDQHPESVKQVAVADRLVVTKTDLAAPEVVAALMRRLRGLNPAAPITAAARGSLSPTAVFDAGLYNPATKSPDVGRWLNEAAYLDRSDQHGQGHGHDGHHHGHEHGHACASDCDHGRHDRRITSFCLVVDKPMPWERFLDFADALIAEHGDKVLRLKGLLNIQESPSPLVIHGVQHLFHPVVPLSRWPDDDHRSRIIVITRDLGRNTVETLLDTYLNTPIASE